MVGRALLAKLATGAGNRFALSGNDRCRGTRRGMPLTRLHVPGLSPCRSAAVSCVQTQSEPCDPIRARVQRGRPPGDQVGNHRPGHGAERQAEMAVAEGVEDIFVPRRGADHRQRGGHRKPKSHPEPSRVRPGNNARARLVIMSQRFGLAGASSPDRAAEPDSAAHRRHRELVVGAQQRHAQSMAFSSIT